MTRMTDTIAPLTEQATEEYAVLEGEVGAPLIAKVNDLNLAGWYLVSVIVVTGGGPVKNRYFAYLRRAIHPLPPRPPGTPAGWYDDPARRHEVRYWDGQAWTHSVGTEGVQGRDAPTYRQPTPGLVQH